MSHPNPLLRYQSGDRELLNVEDLSLRARVSRAFVHLCIALGCPTIDGRLSQEMLMEWLFENYASIRRVAGLPELACIEGVGSKTRSRLRLANTVVTILEFSASRSSDPAVKALLHAMKHTVERALNRQ